MTKYNITAANPKAFRRAVLALAARDLAEDRARDLLEPGQSELRHGFWVGGRHLGYEVELDGDYVRLLRVEALTVGHYIEAYNAAVRRDLAVRAARPLAERLAGYKEQRALDRLLAHD